MTIPNVGVSGVIQNPGVGSSIAQGFGGIAQMLMKQQELRDQQARDAADIKYKNELSADLSSRREEAIRTARMGEEALRLQTEASNTALKGLMDAGILNAGEYAAYSQMSLEERSKALAERMKPLTLAGDSRLLRPAPGGYTTAVGVDRTPPAVTRPGDVAEAMEIELGLPRDTPIADLSVEQRQRMDRYINRKVATGAARSSVTLGGNAFAEGIGKGAAEGLSKTKVEADDAVADLGTIKELRGLLDEGMITGTGAKALTAVGNVLATLGVGGEGVVGPVARSQAYAAIVGQRVGRIIKQFGSGTGLSDADRQYAERIAAGDVALNEKALRFVLDIGEKVDRFLAKRHNDLVDKMPTKGEGAVPESVRQMFRVDVPEFKPPTREFRVGGKVIVGRLDKQGRYVGMVNGKLGILEEAP